MDTENQQRVSPQQAQMVSTPPARKKFHAILLGVGAVLLFGLGFFGGYILKDNGQPISPSTNQVAQVSPIKPSTNTPTPIMNTPADWTITPSTVCNVNFPIPPKKAPYYIPDDPKTSADLVDDDGHFWTLENSKYEKNPMFTHTTFAVYSHPEAGGSEYTAGVVSVDCGPNTNNDTTQSLLDKYEKKFGQGTYVDTFLERNGYISLWNRKVAKVTIKGGIYNKTEYEYLFATEKHLYRITKTSMSKNSLVQETTNTIFNNLTFKD